MTTNPTTLPQTVSDCPLDCPYLVLRTFLPNTLPFYCQQHETFLGVSPNKQIQRCAACRGVGRDVTATGLSLIESYLGDNLPIRETQEAFLKLEPNFQRMFVDFVSKTGTQIVLSDLSSPDANLSDDILKAWKAFQEQQKSNKLSEFKDILDGEDMPFIRGQTKTLLMNLFQVLDKSEQEMLKNIMLNEKLVEAFLDQFEHQPQDNDLLKNVRALIYDYDKQREEQERLRQQQKQQEELILNLARQRHMQREGGR